jgi:hypothetical protein
MIIVPKVLSAVNILMPMLFSYVVSELHTHKYD